MFFSSFKSFLTFGADAAQVSDLHEGLGEHEGHAGSPFAGVNLQRLQQRLLQHLHLRRLLQVLTVCSDGHEKRQTSQVQRFTKWLLHARPQASRASSTSRDETDGAEEAALCVVHLQRQQLAGECEDLIRQRSKPGIVDLSAGQGQPVGEGHGVLVRSVASANPQDLDGVKKRRIEERQIENKQRK